MKRKILGFTIILSWILGRSVKSYIVGDADLQELSMPDIIYNDEADWYSSGKVEFAINIFDDEWKDLHTQEEMIAACQIPDKLLRKLTTHDLLKLTEAYPLLGNIYTGNTIEEGFQYVIDSFNGLQELLKREDCLKVVCEEYDNLIIPEKQVIDYSGYQTEEDLVAYINEILEDDYMLKIALQDSEPIIVCDLLEMIMLNKTTDDNVGILLENVVDKASEKEKAECFGFENKSLYISELEENMLSQVSAYVVMENYVDTPAKLYWKGKAIDVVVMNNPRENTPGEVEQILKEYVSQGAKLVSLGSNKYNCHSYAWLRLAFPNTYDDYCLNIVPNIFMDKCKKFNEPHKQSIAYKAQHSAVIVDETNKRIEHDKPILDPIVKAKWGNGPVVKAPMSVGPMGMELGEVYGYYYYGTFPK